MSPSVVLLLASVIVLAVWCVAAPRLMWIDAQLTRLLLAPTESSRLAIQVHELAGHHVASTSNWYSGDGLSASRMPTCSAYV